MEQVELGERLVLSYCRDGSGRQGDRNHLKAHVRGLTTSNSFHGPLMGEKRIMFLRPWLLLQQVQQEGLSSSAYDCHRPAHVAQQLGLQDQ